MKLSMQVGVAGAMLMLALVAWVVWRPLGPINLIAAIGSRRVAQGQAYGPQERQVFDLYRPDGAAPAGGWPLVVFIYGGSWHRGERADYRFVGEALAARGVLSMVVDYRLSPQVRYPDFVRDCAAAVAHALAQAAAWGANPHWVLVMGHSAGAYNAAMVALDPRWLAEAGHRPDELAGWIGLAGPYDFLPITNPDARVAFNHPNVPADSQPIRYAAQALRPALLLAAHTDILVNPVRNSRQMAAALTAAGQRVTLHEYPRVNHLTLVGAIAAPLRWLAPVLDEVVAFIDTLAPVPAAALADPLAPTQATLRTSPSP